MEKELIKKLKHIETFYEHAPPGMVKEEEEKPEESIPDTAGNKQARDFLANAPSKGLWMPLGKEVKVMQCWRCKNYGHRTGDRECPMFKSGNQTLEKFREIYEDPMHELINSKEKQDQRTRLNWLKQVLDKSSTDSEPEERNKKKKAVWVEKERSEKKRKKRKHSSDSEDKQKKKKKKSKDSKKHKSKKKGKSK